MVNDEIQKLRFQGLGYKKIAQELGISENTVKSFCRRSDHLTKKTVRNKGQKPQYYVEENHEPIISRKMYETVQLELERRREKHCKMVEPQKYAFTGKIVCENCGKNYRRKVTATRVVWICSTFDKLGKKECASKQIPDETLCTVTAEVLEISEFDAEVFEETINKITVPEANHLIFHFKDGHTVEKVWKDRSRSESWTPEMREQVRHLRKCRMVHHRQSPHLQ